MDFTATGLSLGFLIQTNGGNRLRQWKAVVGSGWLLVVGRWPEAHCDTFRERRTKPLTAKGSKFAKRKSLDAKPLTKYNNLAISPNDQGQQPTTAFLLPLTLESRRASWH